MSYNFGQFRSGQFKDYLTSLSYQLLEKTVSTVTSENTPFIDKVLSISDEGLFQNVDNSGKQKSYFIRFKIYKRTDSAQSLTVRLCNTQKDIDNIQTIKSIKVEQGEETDYSTFELIISPNNIYHELQFVLSRDAFDYEVYGEDGSVTGRIIKIEIENFSIVYDIMDFLKSSIENKGRLKQIGVQGPTGLLMCINGEAIRIGRTGIYEIKNGISVNSIGFVIEPDDNKIFILDYQY